LNSKLLFLAIINMAGLACQGRIAVHSAEEGKIDDAGVEESITGQDGDGGGESVTIDEGGTIGNDGGVMGDAPWPGDYPWQGDGDETFDLPIWSPEARWSSDPEPYLCSGIYTFLEGDALGSGYGGQGPVDGLLAYGPNNGPYGLVSHDLQSNLYFMVAGAARGYLDGPFSRARLGGGDYSHRPRSVLSPEGRYLFFTEPYFGDALRRADMVEQNIVTLSLSNSLAGNILGLCSGETGELLIVLEGAQELIVADYDGLEKKRIALGTPQPMNGWTFPLHCAYDDYHRWLYAALSRSPGWYVWYWDLNDGSFHGVLPAPADGQPSRAQNECGPFEGTKLYHEMNWLFFGPDDPQKKYIYVSPNDTLVFFRLDLENRWVWGCSNEPDGVRFIDRGIPKNFDWGTRLNRDGDIITNIPFWNGPRLVRYRRIK